MNFTDKEIGHAKQLKEAGLEWTPEYGDYYTFPDMLTSQRQWLYPNCPVHFEREPVWLPLWPQCREILRQAGYHLVEHREVQDGNLVLIGVNKDLTAVHDYTAEGATDLEAMYKVVLSFMRGRG